MISGPRPPDKRRRHPVGDCSPAYCRCTNRARQPRGDPTSSAQVLALGAGGQAPGRPLVSGALLARGVVASAPLSGDAAGQGRSRVRAGSRGVLLAPRVVVPTLVPGGGAGHGRAAGRSGRGCDSASASGCRRGPERHLGRTAAAWRPGERPPDRPGDGRQRVSVRGHRREVADSPQAASAPTVL